MSMTCKATIRLICEYLEGRLALRWRVKFSATGAMRELPHCFDAAALTLEVYFDREWNQSTDPAASLSSKPDQVPALVL